MFSSDVRDGLSRAGQKTLPCEYFYDAVGSALFEAITVLPEYGLTRADARIIRSLAPVLTGYMRTPCAVAELGSGSGAKTRAILQSLAGSNPVTYYPIDLSSAALASCARDLASCADVRPIHESYLEGLRIAVCKRRANQSLLVLFLGSTIGNFAPGDAQDFLREVRGCLSPGDALLLGTDLVKPLYRMLAAYNDATGVTAAFNLNLLARINRELGADFMLHSFAHEVRWNSGSRRIEMHLRSRVPQRVTVRAAGVACEFRKDETIWTESCHKFDVDQIAEMAGQAGFECSAQWVDETWPFAESLLTV